MSQAVLGSSKLVRKRKEPQTLGRELQRYFLCHNGQIITAIIKLVSKSGANRVIEGKNDAVVEAGIPVVDLLDCQSHKLSMTAVEDFSVAVETAITSQRKCFYTKVERGGRARLMKWTVKQ